MHARAQYATPALAAPQLNASASRDAAGRVHVSLCNLHHEAAAELTCQLRGMAAAAVTGRILTAPTTNGMNTFDQPDAVTPAAFDGF